MNCDSRTSQQPREHDVACRSCMKNRTWNRDAVCDPCHARAAISRLAERSFAFGFDEMTCRHENDGRACDDCDQAKFVSNNWWKAS